MRYGQLLPCPFCRGTDIREVFGPVMPCYFTCESCGATGPTFDSKKLTRDGKWPRDAARDAWNKRP